MTAGTNSLSFSWPPPEGEIVARYEIAASYVGDCPEIASTYPDTSSANFPSTTVQNTELKEFSNYSLSVTAVNDAGRSETSTLVATTLSTGELFQTYTYIYPNKFLLKMFCNVIIPSLQLPVAQYRT